MDIRLRDGSDTRIEIAEAVDIVRSADYVRWYDALPSGALDRLDVADLALPAFLDGVPNFKQLLAGNGWDNLSASLTNASGALRGVPAHTSLNEWADTEPHRLALEGLFKACTGGLNHSLPGFGPARSTKMLHKKRPALIPIIDSWQMAAWAKRIDPWATSDMVDITFELKALMAP